MDADGSPDPVGPALHALSLLADPKRAPIDARGWLIVLAHPDDETLGLGAQLCRLRGARLVLVTDGAPRRGDDPRKRGFDGPASYAAARADELRQALAAGGAGELAVERLDIPDQDAALDLPGLVRTLRPLLAEARVVFTHAYEGGHPDHDAVAFAVHEAASSLDQAVRPAIVDMPFYRQADDGSFAAQDFEPVPGHLPVQLALAPDEVARKRAMMAAHRSQAEVLAAFDPRTEHFRQAPAYDFERLPNGGALWYENLGWDIDGQRWLALVAAARAAGQRP